MVASGWFLEVQWVVGRTVLFLASVLSAQSHLGQAQSQHQPLGPPVTVVETVLATPLWLVFHPHPALPQKSLPSQDLGPTQAGGWGSNQ